MLTNAEEIRNHKAFEDYEKYKKQWYEENGKETREKRPDSWEEYKVNHGLYKPGPLERDAMTAESEPPPLGRKGNFENGSDFIYWSKDKDADLTEGAPNVATGATLTTAFENLGQTDRVPELAGEELTPAQMAKLNDPKEGIIEIGGGYLKRVFGDPIYGLDKFMTSEKLSSNIEGLTNTDYSVPDKPDSFIAAVKIKGQDRFKVDSDKSITKLLNETKVGSIDLRDKQKWRLLKNGSFKGIKFGGNFPTPSGSVVSTLGEWINDVDQYIEDKGLSIHVPQVEGRDYTEYIDEELDEDDLIPVMSIGDLFDSRFPSKGPPTSTLAGMPGKVQAINKTLLKTLNNEKHKVYYVKMSNRKNDPDPRVFFAKNEDVQKVFDKV